MSYQIAAKLLKILERIFEKAQHDDSNSRKNYSHWLRCLDLLITINGLIIELHEIHSSNQTGSEPLSLFPGKPDLRSDPKIEALR